MFDTKLVGEFLKQFEQEVGRLRAEQTKSEDKQKRRLAEIQNQIERLVDAIAGGDGSTALSRRIGDLEREQAELDSALDASDVIPFPKIEAIYRIRVERLIDGLSDIAIRQEAISIIQSMIDKVVVTPTDQGFDIGLQGDLGALLALVNAKGEPLNSGYPKSSLSVVAGARSAQDPTWPELRMAV